MKKRIVQIILMILCFIPAGAQLKYNSGESLSIGVRIPDPNYGLTADGFHYLELWGSGSCFRVSTNHTLCYLTATGWNLLLLDREAKTYNDLRAQYVLLSANGEIYDTWVDPQLTSSTLRSLRPVTFQVTNNGDLMKMKTAESGNMPFGFVAEEVEKLMPDAVVTDDSGNKLIDYGAFLPLATQTIVNLYDKLKNNEKMLEELKK